MDTKDTQLSQLLQRWPACEPSPAFAQNVLRRVRLETARPARDAAPGLAGWLPAWLVSPRRLAWVTAGALSLAFVVGLASVQTFSPPAPTALRPAPLGSSILDRGTVSGDYVALIGDARP